MKTIMIITAAGIGKRMGSNTKKQYLNIGNKPILYYTLRNISHSIIIDEIVLVLSDNTDIEYVKKEIIEKYNIEKVTEFVLGGKERQDSVFNALELIKNKETDNLDDVIISIHDGVRPFVSENVIINSIHSISKKSVIGSVVGVNVKDTIREIDRSNELNSLEKTLDRDNLISIQTPQTFKFNTIYDAHSDAKRNNFLSTDDAALVKKYSKNKNSIITLVEGDYFNIKITTKEDLTFAEAILVSKRG